MRVWKSFFFFFCLTETFFMYLGKDKKDIYDEAT